MDYEETMVEEDFDEAVEDDTQFDDFVEEDESEDEEDFPSEEELELPDEEEEEVEEEETPPPPSEPGWIKQRVNKAVEKAIRETRAEMQAMFDEQMRPFRERFMEDEAQELVRSRKVADIETARELVRLRQGQPTTANPTGTQDRGEQLRNEQGQFVSKEQIASEAAVNARIKELRRQAEKIKANGGPDVIEEFTNNPDIKERVINEELDFYDVAEMMSKPRRRPPAPSRSPNGAANVTPNTFANMSSKQFARFERQLDDGVRYRMK